MTDDTNEKQTRAHRAGGSSSPPALAPPAGTASPSRGGARGYSWPPFEKGHTLSLKHGAFSRYVIPEADELVPVIVDGAPHLTPADAAAVRDYAIAQVRAWRLAAAVEASGELDAKGKPVPALALLRDWLGRAQAARARLGLDPTSRAALAVDELTAQRQHAALLVEQEAEGRRIREAAEARGVLAVDDEGGDS